MMIKQLEVKNFQSHKHSVLDFVPGVNVIVGRSQAGKTALLRALQWVCFNQPRGFRFLSSFSDDGKVSSKLTFDDGAKVELSRSKNQAVYSLTVGDEVQTFEKFSFEVPDLIRETINLNSLNIQNQLEEPFLVLDNGGRIAQEIAKITHIEKVDKWLSVLNSMYFKANQSLKFLKDEKEEITRELEKLEKLDYIWKFLRRGEKIERKLDGLYKKWRFLSDWATRFRDIQSKIERLSSLDSVSEKERKIDLVLDKYRNLINKLILFENFLECCDLVSKLETKLKVVEKGENIVRELLDLSRKENIFTEILEIEDIIKEKEDRLFDLKEKYIAMLKKVRKCPLCLSVISEKQLSLIEREI